MNTNTATDSKRKFQKRYHFGRGTPCRLMKIPLQLMPQIETLLQPWERADYEPLSEEMLEQRKRVSVKEIVAKEIERIMKVESTPAAAIESVPSPSVIESVPSVAIEIDTLKQELASLKTEIKAASVTATESVPLPVASELTELKQELASLKTEIQNVASSICNLANEVESLKGIQAGASVPISPVADTNTVAVTVTDDKPSENVAVAVTVADKPGAKSVAIELHKKGLKSPAIAVELERQGYVSRVGKRIDAGVISRWIRTVGE